MLRIDQIKVPVRHSLQDVYKKIASLMDISVQDLTDCRILKRSLDARKKPEIYYVYSVAFCAPNETKLLKKIKNLQSYEPVLYQFPKDDGDGIFLEQSPVVIGAGPAGLFAAYELALAL